MCLTPGNKWQGSFSLNIVLPVDNWLQVNHEYPSHILPYSIQNSARASLPALALSWTSQKPTARRSAEPQRHNNNKSQRTLESTKQHPPKQASEQRMILVIRLPPDGHSWNTIEEQKPHPSLDWSSLPLVTKPHVHKLDALCSTRSRQLISPRSRSLGCSSCAVCFANSSVKTKILHKVQYTARLGTASQSLYWWR